MANSHIDLTDVFSQENWVYLKVKLMNIFIIFIYLFIYLFYLLFVLLIN